MRVFHLTALLNLPKFQMVSNQLEYRIIVQDWRPFVMVRSQVVAMPRLKSKTLEKGKLSERVEKALKHEMFGFFTLSGDAVCRPHWN